ncbi:MAG TPA: DUF748 domain-containing protein [Methylomirabilota bacterium]|nr:DUF748 domain-containing protein [Methylomirabilota bacterium]
MAPIWQWFRAWRLLSWRSALVAVVVLYALVGFFVVPWIVRGQIETRSLEMLGRQATVERVRFNPFTLSLTIEGFSLPDRPGSVLLAWDRLYANAELSSLFRWAATLKELRIENPYVALRRFDDGAVNVLELMDDLPEGEPDDEGGLPRALLQHVHVVDAQIDVEDRHRPEPLLWELGPSQVELTDISTIPDREGSNEIAVRTPDGGTLSVDGTVVVEPLGLAGTLSLENASLARLWEAVGYLFEFDLHRGDLDLELEYTVGLEDDGLHLTVAGLDLGMTGFGLQWRGHDVELLGVETIDLRGGRLEWPEQVVAAETVIVDGATAFAWLNEDGTGSWADLVPEPTRKQIVEVYRTLEERLQVRAELARFELRGVAARFEDRTFATPIRFAADDVDLVVTDITTEHGTTWPVQASATLAESARGTVKGAFGASPLAVDVEVGLEGLDLARYQPYVARFAPLDLGAGVLEVAGVARASQEPGGAGLQASFEGGFGIENLTLDETVTGGRLLGWGDLEVGGIAAQLEPMSARVEEADVFRAGLEITVAEDGTINLLEFFKAISQEESGAGGGLPPVAIARFRFHDCYGRYTDRTVAGPYEMSVTPVNGTVSGITTTGTSPAELDIEAGISSGGLVRIGGELDLFDYTRLTDLSIDLRDVALPAMSPMSVKFIGHPITDGDVTLDLDYDIADRYLKASNRIEADDLVLGDKVEGEGLVNLPFKLGVSLLKDKEGRITLDIPFEGSFDTPGFGMATAAAAASKEIFTELVTSPFKLLGKLGGGGAEEDLEHVEFAAGSAELDDRAAAKLTTLAAGLAERPALAVGVVGVWDAEADGAALRAEALDAALAARGATPEQLETTVPLELVEALYSETVAEPTLEALRGEHTTADPESPDSPGTLDEVDYRRALRERLLAAQPVDPAAVEALAPARAEAVRTHLVDAGGLDGSRVKVLEPSPSETPGDDWVRCRLEVAAD